MNLIAWPDETVNRHMVFRISDVPQKPKKSLQMVLDYIHENIHTDQDIETLASKANLSQFHFIRKFKSQMGRSPNQYVIYCRIERAKQYLKNTNFSVAKIANLVGYESQSHFCRLFKRFEGVSALAYRKQINQPSI